MRNANISRQPSEPNEAWIENPEQAGLIFVGYADEIVRLRHNEWFCDDFCDETMRGVVYRFTGRRHGFIAGHNDPYNDGPAYVWLKPFESDKDAARYADDMARVDAEAEREFQEQENARLYGEDHVERYQDAD